MTQQICDRLRDFETDNQMLLQAVEGVRSARQTEDTAYRRYSGKDFASDDLKAADALEDKYMSTIHNLLNALLYLPETVLTQIVGLLLSIEDRAQLYYISGGTSGGTKPTPDGGSSDDGGSDDGGGSDDQGGGDDGGNRVFHKGHFGCVARQDLRSTGCRDLGQARSGENLHG